MTLLLTHFPILITVVKYNKTYTTSFLKVYDCLTDLNVFYSFFLYERVLRTVGTFVGLLKVLQRGIKILQLLHYFNLFEYDIVLCQQYSIYSKNN